tara:strand:- start:1548 stop:2912 length:1365 start_codon:yes stop_codon:yes gene_type:complete
MAVIADKCPEIIVTLVDLNSKRIAAWNNSDLDNLPVYEPKLKSLVKRNRNKNLFFKTNIEESIGEADLIFISVNTPTKEKGLGAGYASDLKWVESSARTIAEFAKNHTIVVEKSTVPVRTAELIKKILSSSRTKSNSDISKKTFSVLSSPEFLAEGTAIEDLENPDRVLIGGDDHKAMETLSQIYQRWIPKNKIFMTNLWSSELSKLTANAFLAQRISSINAISSLCESTGADIREVAKAIGADSRIGSKFLNSGPGFGGSCFQKDLLNIVYLCRYYGLNEAADYWEQVIYLNEWQKRRISKLVIETFFGTVSSKKILILGFSFKSNTNDTRYSPSISIAKELLENGANLYIHDPKVNRDQISEELDKKNPYLNKKGEYIWHYVKDLEVAFEGAEAILILTEWPEYSVLNWEKISNSMRKPAWLFDTRGLVKEENLINTHLNFWKIGQGVLRRF